MTLHLHFYGNGGIRAEGIDDFDIGSVFAGSGIAVS